MRDMAIKLNVPLEDLEHDIYAQRYVKLYLKKPEPYRDREPGDASGFTDLSVQTIRKR